MKVVTIAGVTLREALRRKLQVNLLLFGLFMVGVSYVVSTLTLGEMHRIISDLGLSSMAFIGSLIAVFLGAGSVSGDIDRRVVYAVIAKPVSRSEYVIGRYAGLSVALLLNLLAMAVALAAILAFDAGSLRVLGGTFWAAVAMVGVQLMIVAAVAVFFSSITTTTLAAIFALGVTIAGQLSNEMRNLWRIGGAWIAKALWFLLPNLGSLTLNEAVIYRRAVPGSAWLTGLYGLLYAATAIALACVIFERRDFR
jgi:ABC-type transport system involved in multi-copper enzyme maturation permease subunit